MVSVCLCGGCLAAFDIVGINKLLLGGERFCDVSWAVMRCWRECGSLLNLGLRVIGYVLVCFVGWVVRDFCDVI